MKKEIFSRAMTSFAFSVLIAQFIMLILDICLKDYVPLVPSFNSFFSSETVALSVNNLLIGIIGATFGGCSIIFEIERWSFLKQGIIHFLITAAVWFPISMFLWGLYLYPSAVLSTTISLSITYLITWVTRYIVCRKSIGEINKRLESINAQSKEKENP